MGTVLAAALFSLVVYSWSLVVYSWSLIVVKSYMSVAVRVLPAVYVLSKKRIISTVIGVVARTGAQVILFAVYLVWMSRGVWDVYSGVLVAGVLSVYAGQTTLNHRILWHAIGAARQVSSAPLVIYEKVEGTLEELSRFLPGGKYCYRKGKDAYILYWDCGSQVDNCH